MRSIPLHTARLALVATIAVAMSMAVPTPADADEPSRLDFSDAQLTRDEGRIFAGDFGGDGSDDIWLSLPGRRNDMRWDGTDELAFDDWGREAFDLAGNYDVIIAGDFDGDGDDDLWLVKFGPRNDRMLLATGANSFENLGRDSFDISGAYHSFVVGDFSGDGRDDVWLTGPGRGNDRMLTSLGANSFHNHGRTSFDVNGDYNIEVAGDYNGDGRDDVWLYGVGRGNDRMMTSQGINSFRSHGRDSFDVAGNYFDISVGDFSGDGRDDLVLHEARGNDRRFNGAGTNRMQAFGRQSVYFPFGYYFMIQGDWNGDGLDDLYAVGEPGQHRVLTSDGENSWFDHSGLPFWNSEGFQGLSADEGATQRRDVAVTGASGSITQAGLPSD